MAMHRRKEKAKAKACKAKAANDDAEKLTGGQVGQQFEAPADERAEDGRMKWADALRRAVHFDVLKCPCGGKRKLISAIMDDTQVEKILRHVGLWRDDGSDDCDVVEIRGPPGGELYPAEDELAPQFDCVDEPPLDEDWQPADDIDLDWAA
jgi:hypothetical protein